MVGCLAILEYSTPKTLMVNIDIPLSDLLRFDRYLGIKSPSIC